jgi:hypothetical protein
MGFLVNFVILMKPHPHNLFKPFVLYLDVKLIEPISRTLMAAFFVKSNSSFMQEQIPDGTYKVLFVLGNGWNVQTQSFTKNKSFAKFDKLLNFTTMQVSGGIQYKVFKITLHPVTGGKARTSGVSQKEFDSY